MILIRYYSCSPSLPLSPAFSHCWPEPYTLFLLALWPFLFLSTLWPGQDKEGPASGQRVGLLHAPKPPQLHNFWAEKRSSLLCVCGAVFYTLAKTTSEIILTMLILQIINGGMIKCQVLTDCMHRKWNPGPTWLNNLVNSWHIRSMHLAQCRCCMRSGVCRQTGKASVQSHDPDLTRMKEIVTLFETKQSKGESEGLAGQPLTMGSMLWDHRPHKGQRNPHLLAPTLQ